MLENGHPLAHLGLCKYLFRKYADILSGLAAQNAHSARGLFLRQRQI